MAELLIRNEHLAWQLLDIARRENRSVEDVLASLLASYGSREEEIVPEPGSFPALLKSAEEANLLSEQIVDTSERTKDILNSEFADYVRRHSDEQSHAN